MNDTFSGSITHQGRNRTTGPTAININHDLRLGTVRPLLNPLDPIRQAKRIPIRILKMLTAHTAHLLHPEYLQPLQSAPVSIELDAKKSPLALLAQTCSQIGKPDPPSSKLNSVSSTSLGDKETSSRSSGSSLKLGEHRPSLEDKSSFKPYSKVGGDCRRDTVSSSSSSNSNVSTDKAGFRTPGNANANSANARNGSPNSRTGSDTPPQHAQSGTQHHRQNQSPSGQPTAPSQTLNGETKREQCSPGSSGSSSNSGHLKKEAELSKTNLDSPHQANSSHARASVNSSNGSSDSGSNHEGGKSDSLPSQSSLGPGHIAPISPYKAAHSVFPLPSSAMGYHGSVVGSYAGYPSQFVTGMDHNKSSLGVGGMVIPGKHPSSSSLSRGSPPSFMQGLCRDPYCLSYPSAPHLGGSNCNSCVHDPSSSLKSGYPLVYPSHPLHSLHPSTLSSSVSPSLSHPLYTYGFMLSNDPLPHACNWVSSGGPCERRFATSDELLVHLRSHTSLPGGGIEGKLLSAYPSVSSSGPASCHLHLPSHQSSPSSLQSTFSLRGPPSLGLARYHPYGKVHLPPGPGYPLPTAGPYYPHYALYSQRLGAASALGYQ